MNADADLIQRLGRAEVFTDYQKAFEDATELPLTLRPLEAWQPAHRHQARENPFCALLAQANRTCAACLEVQHRAVEGAKEAPATVTCFAGLCDTAVPIRLGDRAIGFLVTGQVALDAPSEAQFERITRQIIAWGSQIDLKRLKEAYFHSKVLAPGQYAGVIRLLGIFGKHLSLAANQIALREAEAEPPLVRRAKAYIAGHQADPVTLGEVANAMHVSTFYFCKLFKKATGMTFTDYLGRVRIEKAKVLLSNPHLRVSEIAYAVGFQSLTHFNRVFRDLTGESPTRFRENRAAETKAPPKKPGAGIPL
ncbi:MAG: helix-turn-helix domain-containing protein [Verrucomicrobia bacterium]|nr:helix-turn-helix domain-containing protein [Verrucomicrobiota bacterium]